MVAFDAWLLREDREVWEDEADRLRADRASMLESAVDERAWE